MKRSSRKRSRCSVREGVILKCELCLSCTRSGRVKFPKCARVVFMPCPESIQLFTKCLLKVVLPCPKCAQKGIQAVLADCFKLSSPTLHPKVAAKYLARCFQSVPEKTHARDCARKVVPNLCPNVYPKSFVVCPKVCPKLCPESCVVCPNLCSKSFLGAPELVPEKLLGVPEVCPKSFCVCPKLCPKCARSFC